MILRWTGRNLLREAGTSAASLGGIALPLLLVILVEGMFAGESERIAAYPERAGADVWVMQAGVSNMHMATSLMRRDLERAVEQVPGVASVTPVMYVSAFLSAGGRHWYSYVVGLETNAPFGGAWAIVEGRDRPGRGEAVVPAVLAAKTGTGLGDVIELFGRRFRVVGLSAGTYSMANSITFVSYADLQDLLSAPHGASYFLVKADADERAGSLAERIRQKVPEVNAMSRDALAASDRRMAMQMGVEIIQVMTWIGSFVAALVVAFTAYAAAIRRKRELGVAKALGMPNRRLYLAVLAQALSLSALGCVLALLLAQVARPLIQALVPEVALLYPPSTAVRLALVTVAIALTASLLPARRIARLDPADVFRT